MAPNRNAAGYTGVRPRPSGMFSAEIRAAGVRQYLGTFPSAYEAARAPMLTSCFQFTLVYLLFSSTKTQKHFSHKNHSFILLLRTFLSITFQYLHQRLFRLSPIAPCGIDTLISKLATNDLCTCSHHLLCFLILLITP